MRFLYTCLLLLQLSCAGWSTRDIAFQVGSTSTIILDWAQTRTSVIRKCQEANPLIGRCGPSPRVDVYFITMLVGHTMISLLLHDNWRTAWQSFVAGGEAAATLNNWQNGNGVSF